MAYQLIAAVAGLSTILGAVLRLMRKMNAQQREFEETRALARKSDETDRLLLKANLAILDGLKQQGCNGRVSEMHEMLITYAVDK